ncbi:MAG: exodeoxyribonuclease V subunit gamma [Ruminococcus sp.]|nr:exodeoxyribonuclease V subunit gamma [Ruminococcus sp.]
MLEFITGQAGSGKTTLLFERIKQDSEKDSRQLVLVPEQFSYEFDKKLYFHIGAEKFNNLYSLTFTGLARQLFQFFGDPDRKGEYADDFARMILIYQAISAVQSRSESLNYFRRQSSQNGFAEEVLNLITEMKRAGIQPETLINKSEFLDRRLMDKAKDIAEIYIEYNRLMREYGFKDNLDNIVKASETAMREEWFRGMNIYIDEFESFNGDQLEMIKVMLSSAENVYIALRTDDVTAGDYTLFETVNHTYRTIRQMCRELDVKCYNTKCGKSRRFRNPDLEYLSTHILRNIRYTPENAPSPDNIKIFEAKDMYAETEYVCATIKHLIHADKSLKYRDFAIISNNIADYTDILKTAFERYEIPYFLSVEKTVSHTSIMVFFTSLLDLLTARKISSENIFRFMKCGILDIPLTDVSLLENYCYMWNVDGDVWCRNFTAEDENLDTIEQLRQSVIAPVMKLKKRLSGKNTAEKICRLLYEYLTECGAEKSVGRIMGRLIHLNRDYEASELKRLWSCLMDVLDSIAETLGDKIITLSEISRIIRSMLGKLEYSVPPQTLDSVISASARTARLSEPKIVFIMGANDGDFPNQISLHGIFSESDKQKLSQKGIEISRPLSDLTASERLVVYKALSSASEKIFITYTLSDLSGQAKYPAQAVDNIIKMFDNDKIRLTSSDITTDYYAVTMHSAFYHYMQNITENTSVVSSIGEILNSDPVYKKRLEYVTSRSAHSQKYKIESETMQRLKSFNPLRISPTDIEKYNECHFGYFCESCLKLQRCEKKELDARVSGDIIHDCFRSILSGFAVEDFLDMDEKRLKELIIESAEKYKDEKLSGDFGKNPSFKLTFNKLTERLVKVFVHMQNELRATKFRPSAFEVSIRDKNPVVLPFGKDYRLVFGGTIDRVDIWKTGEEKYVRIIDYKSSEKKINSENLANGINIQMLLYLFAITDDGGLYGDCIPAGVLYSYIQLDGIKTEDVKNPQENTKGINSELKADGLVLSESSVLNAMEINVEGNFIPVKYNDKGVLSKDSSCITSEGMKKLREFSYKKLTEMAESLLDGDAEALPVYVHNKDKKLPCEYCSYINICDNAHMERLKTADEESVKQAEEILAMKTEQEEEVEK